MARKASPPRRACILPDIATCRTRFEKLRGEVAVLLRSSAGVQGWTELVPQFRYLRESLTSHHSNDADLNMSAYELAAEVCLRALDYAEFLKTMQTLVQSLYPSAVSEHILSTQLGSLRLAESNAGEEDLEGLKDLKNRWIYAAGLFLLYFVCVPATPQGMDVTCILRQFPRWLQRSGAATFPTQVHVALQTGDQLGFLRLYVLASWQERTLMTVRLRQVQEQALVVLSSAYNNLGVDIAQQWLGLIPPASAAEERASRQKVPSRALMELLTAVAGRGSKRVGNALSKLQMDEGLGELAFRA